MPTHRDTSPSNRRAAPWLFLVWMAGCAGAQPMTDATTIHNDVLRAINGVRSAQNLPPLQYDTVLNQTAKARSVEAASEGASKPVNNRLPALTQAGSFARFALSHEVTVGALEFVPQALVSNPVSKSKISHPSLTHLGFGYQSVRGKLFAVIDLARLVPNIDKKAAGKTLEQRLEEKRTLNSVDPLTVRSELSSIAEDIATQFMAGADTSDGLIAVSQSKLNAATFALGRVTINFQVASTLDSVLIPERTSDPALAYVGYGLAQGNHPDHEPGSLAVVILLAEPQTAHNASRKITNLPPPKAVLKSKIRTDKSLTEQAWTATLTGNHTKAAKLFEQAYKRQKQPALLYEAARAHARNGDDATALKQMRNYAPKVTGEEKKKAEEMIARLEKGESIFTASRQEMMSTEAKRFFVMGQTLFERGEWDGAVDAFQQAYQYSAHPEIIYNIGLAHLRAGRLGEALNFFGEYQRLVPEASSVEQAKQLFEIGVELYATGQFESASRQFAMAYGFLPFPELVYNMGLCYKAMGDRKKAIRFFKEYLINDLDEGTRKEVEAIVEELQSE